jgi:Flp pilus assembly protein TadG
MRAFIGREKQKGGVVAEVGLALPLLLFMMLGLVDVGRGLAAKAALGGAVRAATRYASVRSSTSGDAATVTKIQNYLRAHVEGLDTNQIEVTAAWTPTNTRGSRVLVNVSYPFTPIMPFIPVSSIQLTSSSQSIISN